MIYLIVFIGVVALVATALAFRPKKREVEKIGNPWVNYGIRTEQSMGDKPLLFPKDKKHFRFTLK
jgi:hypothetical protein